MSDVLLTAAEEAAAVARGEMPAASIWHNGYRYFPESRIRLLEQQLSTAREAFQRIEDAGFGGYLTPELVAEVVAIAMQNLGERK